MVITDTALTPAPCPRLKARSHHSATTYRSLFIQKAETSARTTHPPVHTSTRARDHRRACWRSQTQFGPKQTDTMLRRTNYGCGPIVCRRSYETWHRLAFALSKLCSWFSHTFWTIPCGYARERAGNRSFVSYACRSWLSRERPNVIPVKPFRVIINQGILVTSKRSFDKWYLPMLKNFSMSIGNDL